MKWVAAVAAGVVILLSAAALPVSAQTAELERHRLELDIQRLEREAGWSGDVQRWLPAASVLVAAAVALYGAWRYFDERKRERETQVQLDIVHNLERLVDAPSDDMTSNARSTAALRSLRTLMSTGSGDEAAEKRSDVTEVLGSLVNHGLASFDTADDARLPVIYLNNWDDYRRLVSSNEAMCQEVADRYLEHLRAVAKRSPLYLTRVRRENGQYLSDKGQLSDEDAALFRPLVDGWREYVQLLPPGKVRDELIAAFRTLAPRLGSRLFGDQS